MRSTVTMLVWWLLVHPWPTVAHQASSLPTNPFAGPYPYKLSRDVIFTTTRVLSEDLQVSAVVRTGNTSRYFHLHGAYGPLTLIIRPCSGSVNSTIYHVPQSNSSGFLKDYIGRGSESSLAMSSGSSQHVYSWVAAPAGLYLLDLVAEGHDTSVTLYATNLPGLPPVLRIQQRPRLRLQPRLHRNRVTLRWDQSVVDPQMMHYYVVVNSRQNFSSLCNAEAQSALGMNVHSVSEKPFNAENKIHKKAFDDSNNFKAVGKTLGKDDILITCVGSGLSFTISNLQKGRDYYFNIFAMNRQTQLSFLYANAALKYDPKLRPIGLRDNEPATVNIRKQGGRALFRYKVKAGQTSTLASVLSWHVMPCGGSVMAEVRLRKQVIVPRLRVEGYHHLQVQDVLPGQRYTLLISVPDAFQMRQILGVEVLATMKTSLMPQLPSEALVHEYTNMRTCRSVTVAWLPVSSQSVRYCVSASPVPTTETEDHFRPRPNQCDLDHRLRNQFDFAVKQCQDISANDNRVVLVQTIPKLSPGKEYLIQVTVKKIKGKALSYDLLRVRTKPSC